MPRAVQRSITIGCWAVCLLAVAGRLFLFVGGFDPSADLTIDLILIAPFPAVVATVGLMLLFRRRGNAIGRIFLFGGLLMALSEFGAGYARSAAEHGWPLTAFSGWFSQVTFFPAILTVVALPLLLFPDGRLPSPRWRWLIRVLELAVLLLIVGQGLAPQIEVVPDELELDNPIGVPFLDGLWLAAPAVGLFAVGMVGSAVAMVHRFRRSMGIERQQLKWFAFSASIAGVGFASVVIVLIVVPEPPTWWDSFGYIVPLAFLAVPITAGLAIVRYRLYDIDRFISRTLTYGVLAGLLGGVYTLGVALLGALAFQGSVQVAGSTLAVAALFNPLRRRLQARLDRRFSRTGYDPREVLEDFTQRVRDQVDTDAIAEELLEVVNQTVIPKRAAVWVRDEIAKS